MRETPKSRPDINPAVPPAIARVIRTCLQKSPDRRYQSVKDVRNELQVIQGGAGVRRKWRPWRARTGSSWRTIAVVAASVASPLLSRWLFYPAASSPAFTAALHPPSQLTQTAGVEEFPAITPDGKWFLYVSNAAGNPDIHLQSIGGQTAINLTKDSPAADTEPAFSPDGERSRFDPIAMAVASS